MDARDSGSWQLGDLTVRRLGFGAMRVTGTGAFDHGRPRDRDASIAVLRRAVELGVNHVDTAAFYFSALRSANELINRALGPYPEDLVITTKVGPGRDPSGEWLPQATPGALRGQVEENLRQLGRDQLDVVNLRVGGPGPVADHVGALVELQDAGLIRHIGVSNVRPEQYADARATCRVVCVQNAYGLGHRRRQDPLIERCLADGVAFVPFFALAGADREAGYAESGEPVVADVARAHDASPAQIRLAWTLHRGPHVLAIPGTGDLAHLEQNVAAGAIRLSAAELAALDDLHRTGAD